jgi:hypothetical protein
VSNGKVSADWTIGGADICSVVSGGTTMLLSMLTIWAAGGFDVSAIDINSQQSNHDNFQP